MVELQSKVLLDAHEQEISERLCMSMNMVMRYSKHIDQERLAREANKRRS
jgi:hypothetical protein